MRGLLAAALAAAIAGPAGAGDGAGVGPAAGAGVEAGPEAAGFDRTPLFAEGDWAVGHTYDASGGGSWCAADTENAAGQWFSIVAYDDGRAALLVGDPAWRLAPRTVDFRIDVDADRWDVAGAAAESVVSVALDDPEATAAFLAQLVLGARLAVLTAADRRLAAFSLEGSAAALAALFDCWALIDPAAAEADPFGPPTQRPLGGRA